MQWTWKSSSTHLPISDYIHEGFHNPKSIEKNKPEH